MRRSDDLVFITFFAVIGLAVVVLVADLLA
jgi:hypothetical protein